ncbi:MAG: ribose-phosphate pyrophosphokinase [Planctomycetes bacterium]|nr:ribose-phosphate pyrophosphokinase [Planctomycetota bacterium]
MSATDQDHLKIFAGTTGRMLASAMCQHLDLTLGQAETKVFPDGELLVKLDEDVRGRDCYVVLSTCAPVNDSLVELLVFIDCLRRASAKRITAVMPYFGYARQDRKDEGRTPITAKLVANLITAAGAHRVLCMDLHAAQIQGFFDLPVDHLTAGPVLMEHFRRVLPSFGPTAVLSPDVGNAKTANMFADQLGLDLAIIEKRRSGATDVKARNVIGDVKGKTVLMFDDMITTGGTVLEAARVARERGATAVYAACTHAVFAGLAIERLASPDITGIVVTDTIPADGRLEPLQGKLAVLSVARMLGEAVHRIHHDLSVSALFREGMGPRR